MRLYAIPIVKNRWVYYCHSSIPSTSRLTKAVNWASLKWEQLDKAEENTWKKKLYIRGSNLMNQLDYQEWFFKSVPSKEDFERPLDKVPVHYPTILQESQIKSELNNLLIKRVPYHKKYMYYSAYWVPLTCTFVIVPLVPNIPLAYNLFRLYSHYKGFKGAEHLKDLFDYGSLEYIPNPAIDGVLTSTNLINDQDIIFSNEIQQAFKDSPKKPNLIELDNDIQGVLNNQDIKLLVDRLQVPGLELELNRARFQILKSIATERFKHIKND